MTESFWESQAGQCCRLAGGGYSAPAEIVRTCRGFSTRRNLRRIAFPICGPDLVLMNTKIGFSPGGTTPAIHQSNQPPAGQIRSATT